MYTYNFAESVGSIMQIQEFIQNIVVIKWIFTQIVHCVIFFVDAEINVVCYFKFFCHFVFWPTIKELKGPECQQTCLIYQNK